MAQLILEAGADTLDPVMAATAKLLSGEEYRIESLPAEATQDLQYRSFQGDLPVLRELLRDGTITSVMITPLERKWWIMLFCPMFDSEGVPWWSMTVEYRVPATEQAFETVRQVPGVRFVSLSAEEGLDFGPGPVAPDTFPWADARLIRAAVRDRADGWVEKVGPAGAVQQQ